MKISVVIGRFQPLHNEHVRMIQHAIDIADKTVVFVGSSWEPRTLKNPWTFEERRGMLQAVFGDKLTIIGIPDYPYDDESWFLNVGLKINAEMESDDDELILVGCDKDDTTWYLHHFPDCEQSLIEPEKVLDATTIRRDLWEGFNLNKDLVPLEVWKWFNLWNEWNPDIISNLRQQFVDVNKYREQWGEGPFLCVDSILMSEGEWFAIITHKEGTLALPGGFLDKGERTLAGARRECVEEIGYDPGPSPISFRIADKPDRDPRCHNVSIVYVWDVGDNMPTLTAGDDALEVRWMDWHEIQTRREEFRADHFHLIGEAYFNA